VLVSTQADFVPAKEQGAYVEAKYIAMFAEVVKVRADYKVEHYLEGSTTPYETEVFNGLIASVVSAKPKTGYAGYSYQSGAPGEVTTGSIAADGTLILKLYYAADHYEVRYVIEGTVPAAAPAAPAAATHKMFGSAQTRADNLSCAGYVFSGWYSTDCMVRTDNTFVMPNRNVTFTGSWIACDTDSGDVATHYKVEHYLQGSTVPHETLTLYGLSGDYVTAREKTGYPGYSFDATHASNITSGVMTDDGGLVLKLHYARHTHELRYCVEGDIPPGAPATPAARHIAQGSDVAVADDMSYAGYTFSMWHSADVWVDHGGFVMPDSDVTFEGTWLRNPEIFTVLFVDWDNTLLKADYVPYGWDATAPLHTALRQGFSVVGWDIDYTNVQQNLVVTLQYVQNRDSTNPEPVKDPPDAPDPVNPPGHEPSLGDKNSQARQSDGSALPQSGDCHSLAGVLIVAMLAASIVLIRKGRLRNKAQQQR
jgi:uncharacterized repeat protein (TIGR02543 family)